MIIHPLCRCEMTKVHESRLYTYIFDTFNIDTTQSIMTSSTQGLSLLMGLWRELRILHVSLSFVVIDVHHIHDILKIVTTFTGSN